MVLIASGASAEVLRVGDLNTRQIRALDRNRTVVFLQGGMLEEHGPYLPAFTDGILSERLTLEIAQGVVAKTPAWTALLFPPVSVGASGYNEIGRQFSFPGTYAVRPSTLKAMYMDLATELGEQGFKWIMIVHVHGSPLHIAALDEAGDYFRDTYGGRMVNLWGLLPVIGGWGSGMSAMTEAQKKEDGVSLHGGADEHSLMLHLQPNLVAPDYPQAPSVTGSTLRRECRGGQAEGLAGLHRRAAAGERRPRTPHLDVVFRGRAEDDARDSRGRGSREVSEVPAAHGDEPVVSGVDRVRRATAIARSASGNNRGTRGGRRTRRVMPPRSSPPSRRRGTRRISQTMPRRSIACGRTTSSSSSRDCGRWARPRRWRCSRMAARPFSRLETSDLHPRVTGDLAVVTGRVQRTRNVSPSSGRPWRRTTGSSGRSTGATPQAGA